MVILALILCINDQGRSVRTSFAIFKNSADDLFLVKLGHGIIAADRELSKLDRF